MDSPASKAAQACSVCNQRSAVYTCPRCAIRTCSLPCSKSHKTRQSCSGERDKTAYVPMNKYGWGTMANDYVYLEEVGRKAAEWGQDIVKGGFLASAAVFRRGRGRGRGQGRGARVAPRGGGRGKRDVLKMQLDARDVDVEMLPPGMEKRRLNQSTWDVRTKSPLMTIEFVFHSAKDPLAPSASSTPPSFTLLTHRNKLDSTILDAIRRSLAERAKKDSIPTWMKSLVSPAEDEEITALYLMAQCTTSPSHPLSTVYHKLDSTQSISRLLRHRSFVEYPTIEVWEDGAAFNGALIETDGTFVKGEDEPPPRKRRRLDAVGGRKIIKSLIGEYKSDEEREEEKEKIEEENVLDMLGNYGSEEEFASDQDGEGEAGDLEEPTLEDLRDIFDTMRQDSLTEDIPWAEGEDDEEVDWGDSAEDEAEELDRTLKRHRTSQPG